MSSVEKIARTHVNGFLDEWNRYLEIFSLSQALGISWQYLLSRGHVYCLKISGKKSLGASAYKKDY